MLKSPGLQPLVRKDDFTMLVLKVSKIQIPWILFREMSSSDHTVTVSDSLLELRLEQCKTLLLVPLAQLWRRAYFVVWNEPKKGGAQA